MRGKRRLEFSNFNDSVSRFHQVFYLHFQGYSKEAWLKKTLENLGAKIETFLSKEVDVVITNLNHNDRPSSACSLLSIPLSSRSTSSKVWCDSPCDSRDLLQGVSSVMTRGKTIAMMSAAKNQCNGSTNVLENAKKYGLKIWNLEKAVNYIKIKQRETRKIKSNQILPLDVRSLKAPFLKVEDKSMAYRPLLSEFQEWPTPDFLENSNLTENILHTDNKQNNLDTKKLPNKENNLSNPLLHSDLRAVESKQNLLLQKNESYPAKDILTFEAEKYQELPISKEIVIHAKPNTQSGIISMKGDTMRHKKILKPKAISNKRQIEINQKEQQKKKGFCEACSIRFFNLDQHINAQSHKLFIDDSSNFESLDNLISTFPSIETIINSFSKSIDISISDSTYSTPITSTENSHRDDINLCTPLSTTNISLSPNRNDLSLLNASGKVSLLEPLLQPISEVTIMPQIQIDSNVKISNIADFITTAKSNYLIGRNSDEIIYDSLSRMSTPRVLKKCTKRNSLNDDNEIKFPEATPTLNISDSKVDKINNSFIISIPVSPNKVNDCHETVNISHSSEDMDWDHFFSPCLNAIIDTTTPTTKTFPLPSPNFSINTITKEIHCNDSSEVNHSCSVSKIPNFNKNRNILLVCSSKTPPLPNNMEPALFSQLRYPYRQCKVNAFKRITDKNAK